MPRTPGTPARALAGLLACFAVAWAEQAQLTARETLTAAPQAVQPAAPVKPTPPPKPEQPAPAPKLNIVIVEGEGAVNNIRQRLAREPIVEIQDENHKPLAGATVVFLLPDSGASGVFPNGSRMLSVTTNAQGRAAATGLKPNSVAGQFQIRVSANYQGLTGSATISQTNAVAAAAAAAGGASGKLIAIIAVAGAGAAGGGIALSRSGNKGGTPTTPTQPTRPTVSITAGTPNVGPPPR